MESNLGTIYIETDRDDYTGGDTVSGKVVMDILTPILCRGVRLEAKGIEHSYWSTGSGKNRRTYSQTINHLNYSKLLFGDEPLNTLALMSDAIKGIFTKSHYHTFEKGHYEWDFSFNLPQDAPADYESGGNTCIRYEVSAYVDIPPASDFCETKRLTLFESFELPPEKPAEAADEKSFLFDSEGKLSLKVQVENNQYYPGDTVRGSFEVVNNSSKTISEITVGLTEKLQKIAHSSRRSSESNTVLQKYECPQITPGMPETFSFEFVIPQDIYCTLKYSSIVLLDYFVHVNLDVPWAIDLAVDVPILILEEEGCPSGIKPGDAQ